MRNTILFFTVAMLTSAGTTHAQPDSLWSRTFGGDNNDKCRDVIETINGGLALVGYTGGLVQCSDADMWLIRTDADGDSI